jgi:hypothetical protein
MFMTRSPNTSQSLVAASRRKVQPLDPRGVTPPGFLFPILPISDHHSRALPERNLRLRPPQTCGPIGGNGRLEIINTGDVLDEALAGIVLDIDSKGEIGLRLHGAAPPHGQEEVRAERAAAKELEILEDDEDVIALPMDL